MMKNELGGVPASGSAVGRYSRREVLRRLLTASAVLYSVPGLAQFANAVGPLRPASHGPVVPHLRLLKIRHSSFLVELNGVRLGIDLCFAPNLNLGPLFSSPRPSLTPESIGDVDVLLFTSARGDHFDASALKKMTHRDATCIVADAGLAKRVRNLGFHRVIQVHAGEQVSVRGLDIRISPSLDLWAPGPAVGFHLHCGERSVWHMGAPPPLDFFSAPVDFAKANPAEVVLACADGQRLFGRPCGMALDDALLLAALAKARIVIPQHDDAAVSPLAVLFADRQPMNPLSLPHTTRLVSLEHGVWYRVRKRS